MSSIKDVAAKAGVGIARVSRVINESEYVKQETKERIEKVIEELGFNKVIEIEYPLGNYIDIPNALEVASYAGALTITKKGAMEALPKHQDILRFF